MNASIPSIRCALNSKKKKQEHTPIECVKNALYNNILERNSKYKSATGNHPICTIFKRWMNETP